MKHVPLILFAVLASSAFSFINAPQNPKRTIAKKESSCVTFQYHCSDLYRHSSTSSILKNGISNDNDDDDDDEVFNDFSPPNNGNGDDNESGSSGNNNKDDSPLLSFTKSLSQRIAQVEQNESAFVSGLQKRMKTVAKAEEMENAMSYENINDVSTNHIDDDDDVAVNQTILSNATNSNTNEIRKEQEQQSHNIIVELPVISFDALLPNQRLTGSTTDPTFCNILRTLGLGGSFVMTSLNSRQRKLRRFGVVARIELVDVEGDDDDAGTSIRSEEDYFLSSPTAVAFSILGKRRCEILGPAKDMKTRIGRWRRGYDPDGEESRLGWGEERFVDRAHDTTINISIDYSSDVDAKEQPSIEWSNNKILIIDETSEDINATFDAIANATYILPLIEQWKSLASDQTTYDNTDVIAATRRKSGQPGLSVNATALLRNVQKELGPMPSLDRPTAFAIWGAALINPLPPLGVAPEVRGAVLEADGAESKLRVLERGLIKSINNLDGTRPLGM